MTEDIIDVDYIINEPSKVDKPPRRKIVVVEEEEAPLQAAKGSSETLVAAAGAAALVWGFSELMKYLDVLEEDEDRGNRKRLR